MWRDPYGRFVALVDWSTVNLGANADLVVAKYGDTNSSAVTCLEFYRIIRRPRGLFVPQPSFSSPGLASTNHVPTELPEREFLILVEHDCRSGAVISIAPGKSGAAAFIEITREERVGNSNEPRYLRYRLVYDVHRHQLRLDPQEWLWTGKAASP
jgi:hypothetical protein